MNRVPGLVLLAVCGELLLGGGVLRWVGAPGAEVLWAVATGFAVVPAIRWAWGDLGAGRFGFHLLAALALVGAVLLADFLVGAVIAVLLLGCRAALQRSGDLATPSQSPQRISRSPLTDQDL